MAAGKFDQDRKAEEPAFTRKRAIGAELVTMETPRAWPPLFIWCRGQHRVLLSVEAGQAVSEQLLQREGGRKPDANAPRVPDDYCANLEQL